MIIRRCRYGLLTLMMTLLMVMVSYANNDGDKPGVSLSSYKGVPIWVETSATTVTDQEVEAAIQEYLDDYIEWSEVTDRSAGIGDGVVIDYVGYLNGELFEGGQNENYMLVLGSETFVDGFEAQLVGASKGDIVEVNITFPDDFAHEKLAGQNAIFYVTVDSVLCEQKAELNDKFAQSISGCNTVAELSQYVREMLQQSKQEDLDSQIQGAILDFILEHSTFYNIQDSVNDLVQTHIDSVYETYNVSFFQYAYLFGLTEREMKQHLNDAYEQQVKIDVVLKTIADIENLVPNEEDWSAAVNGLNDIGTSVALYGEEESVDLARQYAAYRFVLESAYISYRN